MRVVMLLRPDLLDLKLYWVPLLLFARPRPLLAALLALLAAVWPLSLSVRESEREAAARARPAPRPRTSAASRAVRGGPRAAAVCT